MAASSISCCLGPPAPPKEAASSTACRPSSLRRACLAAAACAVMGMSDGGGGNMVVALARDDGAVASMADAVGAPRAPPRWSDRRQCPPWRSNSLENVVPENLPRAPARRRFSSVSIPPAAALARRARAGLGGGSASCPGATPRHRHGLLLPLTHPCKTHLYFA